jgi:hypothetical protein
VRFDLVRALAAATSRLHPSDMVIRGLGAVLAALVFTSCGAHKPDYGSTRGLATAFGCREVVSPSHLPVYSREICQYNGHRVAIWWFAKEGQSEGFLAASRGEGLVLGPRWLVKCWNGPDCQKIQRTIGGKAEISTGPIL